MCTIKQKDKEPICKDACQKENQKFCQSTNTYGEGTIGSGKVIKDIISFDNTK